MKLRIKYFNASNASSGFALILAAFPVSDGRTTVFNNAMTPNCWIIEYVVKGRGFLSMLPLEYHAEPGDLYILPKSGQEYSFHCDPVEPWSKACIMIDGPLVENLLQAYGLTGKLLFRHCEDALDIFHKIYALKNTREESQYEALVQVNLLFCFLRGREIWGGGDKRIVPQSDAADALLNYLSDGIEADVSINEFSRRHRLNKGSLVRTFHQRYGISPYAYLMKCRIHQAKAMLKFSTVSLKEIALRLRFTDQYHFSNYFKRKEGCSPSAYRGMPE